MNSAPRSLLMLVAFLGLAIQAGSATAAEDKDAKTATSCLRRTEIKATKVLDGRNVLFTMRDRSTYVSNLAKQCPGLRRDMPISLTYSDNRLCAGALFSVLMRAGASTNATGLVPGAVCQLAIFTPISDDEIDTLSAATDAGQRSRRRSDRDAIKVEAIETSPAAAEPQTR